MMSDLRTLIPVMWPELLLAITACVLFLLGVSSKVAARRIAPTLSFAVLAVIFVLSLLGLRELTDATQAPRQRHGHAAGAAGVAHQ
jgi:hypothetical protein